jgi:electron transport complex protein RnfG
MSLQKTASRIPSYRNRLSYHASLLGGIGFLTGAALVIAHVETHEAIERAHAEEQRISLAQVIPEIVHDNNLLEDTLSLNDPAGGVKTVFIARRQGAVTGAAFTMSEAGYSGEIHFIMGVDSQGRILGVRTLSHTETPGLGDKIEIAKHPWVLSFEGKSLADPGWAVKKDGGAFDQFTGATITPRAYVKAVKAGLDFFAAHKVAIIEKTAPSVESAPPAEAAVNQHSP